MQAQGKAWFHVQLDGWVLCRLYNKKNTWEKAADPFEPADDTCSDSLRTLESEVDNDVHTDQRGFHGDPYGVVVPPVVPDTGYPPGARVVAGGADQGAGGFKEDDDWFGDLKLEGLASSPAAFGGEPPSTDFGYQDYLAALAAPQLRTDCDSLPPF